MLEMIAETFIITFTVCITILLFSLITMKYWWWFLKIDLLLFWLSNIATKSERQKLSKISQKKDMWKELYDYLNVEDRKN